MGYSLKAGVVNTFKDPVVRVTWILLLSLLLVLGGYWWWLLDEHRSQLLYAEQQLQLRAEQTSGALASQVEILISSIDYLSSNLSELYVAEDSRLFAEAVDEAFNVYDNNPLIQVAVADAQGQVVFSRLNPVHSLVTPSLDKPLSIVEREHFQVHKQELVPAAGLFISTPVYGRISQKWSIQFSRALRQGDNFVGVLVVSLSPDFISHYFREVFPEQSDVAALLNESGRYLARSTRQDEVMERTVSAELRAGISTSAIRGNYHLRSAWDGGNREYAWHRVTGYPLVVTIGLDRETALSPVTGRLLSNWFWNLVSTTAILLSLLFIGLLISHARRQQREVVANRKRLADLVEQAPGAVYQLLRSPEGIYQVSYISPGITVLLGLSPAEVRGKVRGVFELIHAEDMQAVRAGLEQSAATLQRWDMAFRVRVRNGETRWFSGYSKPQRLPDGSTLWNGYIHDVTQARTDHEALRASEERLRLTIDAVHDGLWEWDVGSDAVHVDDRCLNMLGYDRPGYTLTFALWYELIHPDDRQRLERQLRDISKGEMFRLELRMRSANGTWLWVEIRGKSMEYHSGKSVVGTQSDISQRVAEGHLRNALLNNSAAAILLVAADHKVRLANSRAQALFSQNRSLASLPMRKLLINAVQYDRFLELSARLRGGEGKVQTEFPLSDSNGQLHWLSVQGTLLDPQLPDGDTIWTLVDITERRQMEDELSAAQQRLAEVIRHFSSGVLLESTSGELVMANQAVCRLLGLPQDPASLAGSVLQELWEKLELNSPLAVARKRSEDCAGSDNEVELADGRTLHIETIPIRIDAVDAGRLWILRDITERRRREHTLQQLAATDALTGLANRRAFVECLQGELDKVSAEPLAGSLLMLDLDHFKVVNDTYGHAAGDAALVHFAGLLRSILRQGDIAGRLGGEEFGVILQGSDTQAALRIAERLREALAASAVRFGDHTFGLTTSIGLAPLTGSVTDILARADEALYEAKREGRNRVEIARV